MTKVASEPRLFSPEPMTDEEAAAMFRASLNLFWLWGVNDEQAAVILDLPRRTFARWRAGAVGRIGRDGKARLSNLLGIHKALRIVFGDASRGYAWIRAPNKTFGGASALDARRHARRRTARSDAGSPLPRCRARRLVIDPAPISTVVRICRVLGTTPDAVLAFADPPGQSGDELLRCGSRPPRGA